MDPGPGPRIDDLQASSVDDAARLLAASMRDNPLHARVFAGKVARVEPLLALAFERLLQRQRRVGRVFGAWDGGALVGAAAMVPPGACRPPMTEVLAMLRILVRAGALRHLPRVAQWLSIWARHDPRAPHWHLGPAAVERTRQGQGVGTRLMQVVCDELDRVQGLGWLETDKPENVRLYRRGGFEVVAERSVLGVPNWFMQRRPLPRT